MKKNINRHIKRSLFALKNYFVFFILISFVITCCMLLFLRSANLDSAQIEKSARLTFFNVLFLSLLCTVIDGIRRKLTVEKPVKKILEATEKLTQGDFSVRIKNDRPYERMNEFDAIIENFNKMAEELSGIETLRSDFIANVSHELKTPLASIRNYAILLSAPALSESEREDYAKAISDSAGRLSDLITNILKLNKLENQQIYPQAKKYNLGEQLRECILSFEKEWEAKNIEIDCDIDDIEVYADAELLSIVWNNLISNAIKFSDDGGYVGVSLKPDRNFISVKVSDRGCGMSPEVGKHIFEKFYQGDKSHASVGNGLGLSLVRRVVDIVGADISVESVRGVGSTFTVRIYNNNIS